MKKLFVSISVVTILVLVLLPLAGCGSDGSATSTPAATTPAGHATMSNEVLTDIAPGLGVVMIELGHRNWMMYYAATGGNWDLAEYQIKELKEAIEVGETTRPARKDALELFEKGPLGDVETAINSKDSTKFAAAWPKEVAGCNACHSTQGFKYIEWSLPKTPPEDLNTSPVS